MSTLLFVCSFPPSPLIRYVNKALTVDETGDHMEALELYDSALSTLTSGLAVVQRCRAEGGPAVRDMQSKMERCSLASPTYMYLYMLHSLLVTPCLRRHTQAG